MVDHYATAQQVVRALRRGEITRVDSVQAALDRLTAVGPRVNAVVTVDAERALHRAQDRDRHGASHGVLDGVVVTVKDSFETAGLRTTSGAKELADHVPTADAPAVERLLGAGSLLLGKSNLPKYAGDLQTANSLFGRTDNPWDGSRTCGGSSGGGAAAVAAGISVLDLGSDHAGSIRIPASYCGVFAHRPTYGIVPTRGHIPPDPGTRRERDLTTIGLLARSAADLATALGAVVGSGGRAAAAPVVELAPPPGPRLGDYRVSAWLDGGLPLDAEVRALLERFLADIAAEGAEVGDAPLGVPEAEVADVFDGLVGATVGPSLDDERFALSAEFARSGDDETSSLLRSARHVTQSHRDWLMLDERRHRLIELVDSWFDDTDVIVAPVTPTTAPPHDSEPDRHSRRLDVNGTEVPYFDQWAWCGLSTVAGVPSSVVPIGLTAAGLPVAAQVIGRRRGDLTTLGFATAVERQGLALDTHPFP